MTKPAPNDPRARPKWTKGGRTIALSRVPLHERQREAEIEALQESVHPVADLRRPATRAGCLAGNDAQRPCPYVSCRHHLYLDTGVRKGKGSLLLNYPESEVWEVPETCSLDLADQGGMILDEVGKVMNLTRERVRQIEDQAIRKVLTTIRSDAKLRELEPEGADLPASGRRSLPVIQDDEDDEEDDFGC